MHGAVPPRTMGCSKRTRGHHGGNPLSRAVGSNSDFNVAVTQCSLGDSIDALIRFDAKYTRSGRTECGAEILPKNLFCRNLLPLFVFRRLGCQFNNKFAFLCRRKWSNGVPLLVGGSVYLENCCVNSNNALLPSEESNMAPRHHMHSEGACHNDHLCWYTPTEMFVTCILGL